MTHRPPEFNAFEFVILAAHRAKQLTQGCVPLVPVGLRPVITAQREVADGKIRGTHSAQTANQT